MLSILIQIYAYIDAYRKWKYKQSKIPMQDKIKNKLPTAIRCDKEVENVLQE